ncbi:MAG: hypothetical protein ACK4R6_04390 [Spirosomataceae bacterium]
MNDVLNDICNFQLVVFGISVTIFTVLYSFIIAKRDDIKIVNEQIKLGNDSPTIKQKVAFSISYINQWRKVNFHVKIIIVISFITYLASLLTKNFCIDLTWKHWILLALTGLSVGIFLYISYLLMMIFKDYEKNITL